MGTEKESLKRVTRTSTVRVDVITEGWEPECGLMSVDYISRKVYLNGELVYEDRMKPRIFRTRKDELRNLDCFILGLEKAERAKNAAPDAGKPVGRIKKLWAKLLGKDIKLTP